VAVTGFALRDKTELKADTPSGPGPRSGPQGASTLRQRNRLLALTLATVAGSVFALVFGLVVMFHYLQAHHVALAWM